MKVSPILLPVILLFAVLEVRASEVEALIERVKKTTSTDGGISKEEQEIAEKLHEIGPAAIPYLLPLLRDKNVNVRDLASFTLRDIDGLTEEHLDALMESCRNGDGWIPPAIAKIGTPKAVDFLVEQLALTRETGNQLTYAMELLGEKVFPRLLQVYEADKGWDVNLESTMYVVLRTLGPKAATAVDPLDRIVLDEKASRERRIHAIQALGAIGPAAERIIPDLQKMRKDKDPTIRHAAAIAITQMGTAEAAPIMSQRLEETKDAFGKTLILDNIAALRLNGSSAGPAVAKYLSSNDWEVRIAATGTLGYIGYEAATNKLIALLDCTEDWRVVLSAAEALGHLQAKAAEHSLTRISRDHWYPPVRTAAATALAAIRDGIRPASGNSEGGSSFDFFAWERAGEGMDALSEEDLPHIKFPVAATTDEVPESTLRTVRRGSLCGLKVDGGWLVGADRGEWGGEIMFVDARGKSRVIAAANTEAIYKTSGAIFAVTGLAHLSGNHGAIYKLSTNAAGHWETKPWRALPGAPMFSRLLQDGRLFVNCHGGIVIVSPTGEMKSLTRAECLSSPPAPL